MSRRTYTDEQLIEAVESSFSYSEVARALKLTTSGSVTNYIKQNIEILQLDLSHFDSGKAARESSRLKTKSPEDVLVLGAEHSPRVSRRRLFNALIAIGIAYECKTCKLQPEWLGSELKLEIDHVNGVRWDNRRENLRFLCPNCHSQTSTYGSKGVKRIQRPEVYCGCGERISYTSTRCVACANKLKAKESQRIEWPSTEYILTQLEGRTYRDLGRELGVSDNSIRMHLKRRGIIAPKKHLGVNRCKCGVQIAKEASKCRHCYDLSRRADWPDVEWILNELRTNTQQHVAETIGVHRKTLMKYIDNHK